MKKKLKRVVLEDLHAALSGLGYVKLGSPWSWRRREFHLFLRERGKDKLMLNIHEDVPKSLPPFHRARHEGPKVKRELERILEAYKKQRVKQTESVYRKR